MATSRTESQGQTGPALQATLGLVTKSRLRRNQGPPMSIFEQMHIWIAEAKRRKEKHRKKREANELVSNSKSSSNEEEELEDQTSTNTSSERSEPSTPNQPDPVDEPESTPAFEIRRPTTRSVSKTPISQSNRKASKKKFVGEGSSSQKKRRR